MPFLLYYVEYDSCQQNHHDDTCCNKSCIAVDVSYKKNPKKIKKKVSQPNNEVRYVKLLNQDAEIVKISYIFLYILHAMLSLPAPLSIMD